MLDTLTLSSALARLPVVSAKGVLYRAVNNGYLTNLPSGVAPQPLYSQASSDFGGRYTPRGGSPMLYLAEDAATAYAEAHSVGGLVHHADLTTAPALPPTTLFSVQADVARILDLTDEKVLQELQTTEEELCLPWKLAMERAARGLGELPATQRLGAAACASGRFQALRYPSAQLKEHFCFVLFVEHVEAPSFVEVHDPLGLYPQRIP